MSETNFTMKVVKSYPNNPLGRQIREALMIRKIDQDARIFLKWIFCMKTTSFFAEGYIFLHRVRTLIVNVLNFPWF